MIWLTWRQFRVQAVTVLAGVAAIAVVLSVTGPRLARLARTNANLFDLLTRTDRNLYWTGILLVAIAPAVIGAFWGAPLVARELEAGTHQLAWNQSVTRTRWLATKLGVLTLASAVAAGALSLAVTWWSSPLDALMSATRGNLPSRVTPLAFAMRGIAPVGYSVFALMLGVALGMMLRRLLPAMAITLALLVAVQIAVPLWVRPHLITPIRTMVTISGSTLMEIRGDNRGRPLAIGVTIHQPDAWILTNQTVDAAGKAATLPSWFTGCVPPPPGPGEVEHQAGRGTLDACLARMNAEGYRQRVVYQPANRFWPLQWAETGLFLAASGLLAWFCLWWTRRRLS